jgi:phage terminase Nu1 subunit (DNA packaging protein)
LPLSRHIYCLRFLFMSDVRILNSWKEISNYIGRGVRTVQRWEELYGLPVHRAAGRERSAVYALSDELDAWLRMGRMHEVAKPNREVTPEAAEQYRKLVDRASTLIERLRVLRQQSAAIRLQLERNRAGSSRNSELVEKSVSLNRRPA